ncbi:MAG: DNA mismatch repair protein MutS, partial [Pseudomonadota bacterium]
MNNQLPLPFNSITHGLTPMMKQYLDVKLQYKDAIVFYRMGDFYEMFFEDANIAAPILGIALTKRGQHQGNDIPMCGIPFHSCDSYISKLIEKGLKLAICEQMETPEEAKKRGSKSVVKREVIRIITPGTLTEDNLLNSNASNFLIAIAEVKGELSISWADISTGEFYTSLSSVDSFSNDLARINPKEILISERLYNQENIHFALADYRRIVTIQANSLFDISKAEHKIKKYYNVISSEVFGNYTQAELVSCGAILEYVELTQKTSQVKIRHPKKLNNSLFMTIDAATRRNLEINLTAGGEKSGSLFHLINKTKTSGGARLLAQYLASPLIDVEAINNRLDLVEFFIKNRELTEKVISILASIGDTERSLSRFSFNRGGPRDLQVIRDCLKAANILLSSFINFKVNIILQNHLNNLNNFDGLMLELEEALNEELPLLARDGGFIKQGYNARLDQLLDLKQNSQQQLQLLKLQYIKETGISSLKINFNNMLGYFIDITPQHVGKMNENIFIHRQTLANSVRYTTKELRDLERELVNLSDNIAKLEIEIYNQLVTIILEKSQELALFSFSISTIDVASSLAELAVHQNYCRPQIDNGDSFNIESGRHPVIEHLLRKEKQEFIANDCHLEKAQNLWLITGPNMAGKSTFLRQNALIAILAQVGSFVPARSARFGVVDKIFSRVGAADDLARGRS